MHVVLPRGVRWGAGQIVTVYNSPSLLRGSNIHDHFLLEHTLLINPSPYPCPSLLTVQSFSLDTHCKTLIWMDQRPGFRLCQPRRNSVTSSTPRCRLAPGRPDHRPRRQRLAVARRLRLAASYTALGPAGYRDGRIVTKSTIRTIYRVHAGTPPRVPTYASTGVCETVPVNQPASRLVWPGPVNTAAPW
jgi:hypothetical protein